MGQNKNPDEKATHMKDKLNHYHPVAAAIKVALCSSLLFSTALLAQESTDAAAEKKAEDAAVEKIVAKGKPVYGINTGFGPHLSIKFPTNGEIARDENAP